MIVFGLPILLSPSSSFQLKPQIALAKVLTQCLVFSTTVDAPWDGVRKPVRLKMKPLQTTSK
jgi:hypothetical protein